MAAEVVGTGTPDGTTVGSSATELVGFHGSACDQASFIASVTQPAFAIISAGTGYGFTSTAPVTSLWAAVNSITALLAEKGITAAS